MKAVKVTVREKQISKGRKSLYLDFYPAIKNPSTGKNTRREFLGFYTIDRPKTETERKTNKENKIKADEIRAKRHLSVQKGDYTFFEAEKWEADFLGYFVGCYEKRYGSNQRRLFHQVYPTKNQRHGDIAHS